ncbi:MAG: fructosamine kinase family protein [Comamonadaceae bacterium]|nr:fructosamine kinase family protein [Comamonadaceae bacterium]
MATCGAATPATSTDGTPVIFDPAAYWGDREADLAMTELFGGFGAGFYGRLPRRHGRSTQATTCAATLYNLYHILNTSTWRRRLMPRDTAPVRRAASARRTIIDGC